MKLYFYFLLDVIYNNEYYILQLIINIHFDRYTTKFCDKFLLIDRAKPNYFFIKQFLYYHIVGLEFIIHRIILLVILLYDIKYNSMILTHVFQILPYIFIYELRVKAYTFLTTINLEYDKIIAKLLYSKATSFDGDQDHLYLDGEPYEKKIIKKIMTTYVFNNFIDKNPIKQNLNLLINYWKRLIIDNLFKKYPLIDIIFFCLVITLIYLHCRISK